MALKITGKTEARWYLYQGNVRFKIRPMTARVLRDLRQAAQTGRMMPDPKTRRMMPEIDDEKYELLIRDYLIEDWEGVIGDDDQPLPCNAEAKAAVLDVLPISDFVWEMAQSADLTTEREKNSPAP